jgi:hypothetical protein
MPMIKPNQNQWLYTPRGMGFSLSQFFRGQYAKAVKVAVPPPHLLSEDPLTNDPASQVASVNRSELPGRTTCIPACRHARATK